jgi:ABC-2 type transport system permease protein
MNRSTRERSRESRAESREQATRAGESESLAFNHRPSTLVRYGGIYGALWRNSVTRETMFKGNFLLWILVEFLWFGLQLCFVGVLYLHTTEIGTWTKWQVVMLIGASHFIQQTFQAFFLVNCVNLSELIRTGKFDFLLLLPVNTRFVVSLRQVDLGAFVNAASGVAVMGYAAHQLRLTPAAIHVFGFLALSVAGILIHYSLMFLLATISFWTVRAQGIVWGYYNLFNIARLPDDAFHGLFKGIFTFAVPMLLVSNVPVRLLINTLASPGRSLLLILMSAVCFAVSEFVWRSSLRRYTSASS